MKTIKIACPKCATVNHYTNAALTASQGQAQCTHCNHIFTLVRKNTATPPKTPNTPQSPLRTQDKPTSASPKIPLQAEVLPKAGSIHTPFADPEKETDKTNQAQAAVEALLQRNTSPTPPSNLPTPAIDTLLKNIQHSGMANGPTQNIHIQAQSLVFNLVSGKEAPPTLLQHPPLLLNDADNTPPATTASANAPSSEFNWTLACLVALTTLIIQIFYYFLTRA